MFLRKLRRIISLKARRFPYNPTSISLNLLKDYYYKAFTALLSGVSAAEVTRSRSILYLGNCSRYYSIIIIRYTLAHYYFLTFQIIVESRADDTIHFRNSYDRYEYNTIR